MKPGSDADGAANGYLTQLRASLDMVAHYVLPSDPRVLLARQKLAAIKAGTSSPNAWDERGKTTVPLTLVSTSNFADEFSTEFA